MPPLLQRAAQQQGGRGGAVVGAVGAVDPRGAAELGDHHHHGVLPGRPHALGEAVERRVEVGEAGRQLALARALVGVGVEAVDRDRGHLRAAGLDHEAGQRRAELAGGRQALAQHRPQRRAAGVGLAAHVARLARRPWSRRSGVVGPGGDRRQRRGGVGARDLGHRLGGEAAGQRRGSASDRWRRGRRGSPAAAGRGPTPGPATRTPPRSGRAGSAARWRRPRSPSPCPAPSPAAPGSASRSRCA